MRLVLPRLYVILDSALLKHSPRESAQQLATAGVRLLQFRCKTASARELLKISSELVSCLAPHQASLIVNDRPDVAALAGARGVHVGQDDFAPEQARTVVGTEMVIGVSTHNLEQFQGAVKTSADYVAVGPIFETTSKANPDPVVGLEFIRRVRPLTSKPIVAIGGITLNTAKSVIEAGADCVAVISDIICAASPGERAKRYLDALDALDAANHAATV